MSQSEQATVREHIEFVVGELPNTRVSASAWDVTRLYRRVFTGSFMAEYTLRYRSIELFMDDSPAEIDNVDALHSDAFQEFVRTETAFDSWDDMMRCGALEFVERESQIT